MSEKFEIFGDARFAFRSDTLDNWKKVNPILLPGEFSVVTDGTEIEKVKIGDGKTPWRYLPWWKGPKGEEGVGVGKFTAEGGEIFNDYETNQANTLFSSTRGCNNIVGGKGFKVLSVSEVNDQPNIKCTMLLDTYDGLEIGDIVSANIENNYTDFAKIINISTVYGIQLDVYPKNCILTEGEAFLWVNQKPLIGSVYLGECQSADGVDNVVIQSAGSSSGCENLVGGKFGRTSGKGNFAGFAGHAQNRYNKAAGNDSSASGYMTEALGLEADSGNLWTKALARATCARGKETIAGIRAFEVNAIDFENTLEENPENNPSGWSATYYVSNLGDDATGTGSLDSPFVTVSRAIQEAEIAGMIQGDRLYIQIIGTEPVYWGNNVTYPFEVIVTSENKNAIVDFDNNQHLGGITKFDNVKMNILKDYDLFFNYNDVTTGSKVTIGSRNWLLGGNNNSGAVNKDINLNFQSQTNMLILGSAYASVEFNKDINISYDYASGKPVFRLGANLGGGVKYNRHINFNIKSALGIDIGKRHGTIVYGEDAAIQVINSTGKNIASSLQIFNGLTNIKGNLIPQWHIINNSKLKDVLDFTQKAGVFKVKDGYLATAHSILGDTIETVDGLLDLSFEDGEYVVDIIEVASHIGMLQLNAISYLGEELAVGDMISIKDSQTFILNVGTIVEIDNNTNTLSVEGYPSQMNQFLMSSDTYLFVLSKPKLGTKAIGNYSSTNGEFTQTIGVGAHADGLGTIATADFQYVCGKYNKNRPDTVFEVGCGTDNNNRANAFEVYKDGSLGIYGIRLSRNVLRTLLDLID